MSNESPNPYQRGRTEGLSIPYARAMRLGHDLERVLRICGPDSDHARERDVREIQDWPGVVGLAQAHGLVPLLRRGLTGLSGVPGRAAETLTASARKSARRSFGLASELVGALDVLRSNGIEALPLKGATLAVAAYGDPALRDYGDIDILVRPEKGRSAVEALGSAGFQSEDASSPARQELFLRIDGQISLYRAGVRVELHTTIAEPHWGAYPGLGELISRASATELYGQSVPSLALPDMLLTVCVHASKSGWGRLEWPASLAWLARRGDMDWNALSDRARATGTLRAMGVGFALAEAFLRGPLPAVPLSFIHRDTAVRNLAREVRPHPGTPPGTTSPGARLRHQLWLMRARERWHDRLYLVAALLRPAHEDVVMVDLRPSLRWLYYPLRLVRLLAEAMRIPLPRS